MDKIVIEGGKLLRSVVKVSGAKIFLPAGWRAGLASLSHCVETLGVAFSAIVQGMHIKSRQGRRELLNREPE